MTNSVSNSLAEIVVVVVEPWKDQWVDLVQGRHEVVELVRNHLETKFLRVGKT